MSVRRTQREVDSAEFAEWSAYDTIDPFGEQRADWRLAQLTSIVASLMRDKSQRAYKPADFMWKDKSPRQTLQQQRAIFAAFAQASGMTGIGKD